MQSVFQVGKMSLFFNMDVSENYRLFLGDVFSIFNLVF